MLISGISKTTEQIRQEAQFAVAREVNDIRVNGKRLAPEESGALVRAKLREKGLDYTPADIVRVKESIDSSMAMAFSNNAAEGFASPPQEKLLLVKEVLTAEGLES